MEYLTKLIKDQIQTKNWKPFTFKNKNIAISHVLFEDDILFFCKANCTNIQAIHSVLSSFSYVSGLHINKQKSKVQFSKHVNNENISLFNRLFNVNRTQDLGLYFGFPLKSNYKTNDFNFILDKLNKKLQGWKSTLLSKAGKLQLINSTLSNVSNHVMSVFLLPRSIRNKIDATARNFFWGHSSSTKKLHTIKWENVAKPKNLGGLGIRSANHQNKVQFMKRI